MISLGKFRPVSLRLHVEVKIVVSGDFVGAERIGAHVGVERGLQREARSRSGTFRNFDSNVSFRETGRIVINIHDFDLHTEKLQRVFQKHFQMQEAGCALLANLLSVDFFIHKKHPIFQIHFQIRSPRTWKLLTLKHPLAAGLNANIYNQHIRTYITKLYCIMLLFFIELRKCNCIILMVYICMSHSQFLFPQGRTLLISAVTEQAHFNLMSHIP
uniref:Uncharacterized protein n=1 Tax=Paramormyrops kingsleyae TaxID=1676925 RepID=A0A3B3SV29_9TELE